MLCFYNSVWEWIEEKRGRRMEIQFFLVGKIEKEKGGRKIDYPSFSSFDFFLLDFYKKSSVKMFAFPSVEGFTIYTKSNCPYCTKVKELFLHTVPEPVYINCDSYLDGFRDAFLEFILGYTVRVHRTFPMVFFKGVFIGGYTETKEYMDSNLFSADFTMDF
jgi:glutaredoxin